MPTPTEIIPIYIIFFVIVLAILVLPILIPLINKYKKCTDKCYQFKNVFIILGVYLGLFLWAIVLLINLSNEYTYLLYIHIFITFIVYLAFVGYSIYLLNL